MVFDIGHCPSQKYVGEKQIDSKSSPKPDRDLGNRVLTPITADCMWGGKAESHRGANFRRKKKKKTGRKKKIPDRYSAALNSS